MEFVERGELFDYIVSKTKYLVGYAARLPE